MRARGTGGREESCKWQADVLSRREEGVVTVALTKTHETDSGGVAEGPPCPSHGWMSRSFCVFEVDDVGSKTFGELENVETRFPSVGNGAS
jgi:hypothetical protein